MARARQRRPTPLPVKDEVASVSWRDGVHITSTPIWCDATRARDVCFVSAAHEVRGQRHGQLIASNATLAQLARSEERARPHIHLPVPYRRPFTLGTLRLELLPSGHGLGAASLLVDVGGRRVLYAGPVNPQGDDLGGAGELLPSDTVVIAASYGTPGVRFPRPSQIAPQVIAFCQEVIAADGCAVLLVTSPSKGLDVASRLGAAGIPITAHRAVHHVAQKLRAAKIVAPVMKRHGAAKSLPRGVLLWPTTRRGELDTLHRRQEDRIALVSGLAFDPEARTILRPDVWFAWSNLGDHDAIVAYVEQSGASHVYLTHRHAEALATRLARPGRTARALGPPRQMALF